MAGRGRFVGQTAAPQGVFDSVGCQMEVGAYSALVHVTIASDPAVRRTCTNEGRALSRNGRSSSFNIFRFERCGNWLERRAAFARSCSCHLSSSRSKFALAEDFSPFAVFSAPPPPPLRAAGPSPPPPPPTLSHSLPTLQRPAIPSLSCSLTPALFLFSSALRPPPTYQTLLDYIAPQSYPSASRSPLQ